MNLSKIIAITGILFAGVVLASAQTPVFTCETTPAVFELGLTAEQQRQAIVVSGVVGVNCCATRAYATELTNDVLKVTLTTHGPCLCVDQPCTIELFFSTGVSAVSRVMVETAENVVLLDTSFVQTGVAARKKTVARNTVPGHGTMFDLHGRALRGGGDLPPDMRRKRLPHGVYLMANPDRSIKVIVQP